MPQGYSRLQSQSHSNEVERRLTRIEISHEQTTDDIEAHHKRITLLERLHMGILYTIGALAAGKTGDVAEFVLAILKAKT